MYKKMYLLLFNAITDALDCQTKTEADEILKQAQISAEEIYIEGDQE